MKKCPFFTVLLSILIFVLPISIGAESQSVYDWSGLLSVSEEAKVEEMAKRISDSTGVDIYIVTLNEVYYEGEEFLWRNGMDDEDNIILLIINSYESPVVYDIYTYGDSYYKITDTEIDRLVYHDDVYDNLKSGRFLEGSLAFFKYADVANFGHLAMPLLSILLISVIVGAVVATIVCICVIVKYKTKLKSASYPIDKYAKLVLRTKEDIFLGSSVSRVRVSSSSSSGGRSGGGGGGHRGGA